MASALSLIWSKIIHDLTLYEGEVQIGAISYDQFQQGQETPLTREERLHVDLPGHESTGVSEADANASS